MEYAAVAVLSPVSGRWELMSSGGRVVVFDTATVAWEWLPMLGKGRLYREEAARLRICFLELARDLPNMAEVVSPYDPGERTPWERHIIWSDWWGGEGMRGLRDEAIDNRSGGAS